MHIIIAILGMVITILILINRLSEAGIDIGWLNPFLWKRRRDFRRKYQKDPALNLDSPMEAVALLLLATAKLDGEVSSEEKEALVSIFKNDFNLSDEEAKSLLSASTFLYQDGAVVLKSPAAVLQKSKSKFSSEQIDSTLDMLHRVSAFCGGATQEQSKFISKIESVFSSKKGNWK